MNRVRYYRGRVSNFDQTESRKHCFLASDWLKFETLPRLYRREEYTRVVNRNNSTGTGDKGCECGLHISEIS